MIKLIKYLRTYNYLVFLVTELKRLYNQMFWTGQFFSKMGIFSSLLNFYKLILFGVITYYIYFIYLYLNSLEKIVVIESFNSIEDFFISIVTCLDITGFDSFLVVKYGYFLIDFFLYFLLFNIFFIGLYYEFSKSFFSLFFKCFSWLVFSLGLIFFFFFFNINLIWCFFQGVLIFDFYSLVSRFLIYFIGLFYFYYSYNYYKLVAIKRFEFLFIKLLIIISFSLLISTFNFISFYIIFELISLSLYILAAGIGLKSKSAEAGLKYFILGALSSGFLLLGISLIYGYTGSLNFLEIKTILSLNFSLFDHTLIDITCEFIPQLNASLPLVIGIISILISFLFKFAAVPLHLWAIDVYEGILLPVSGFFSIVVKFGFFLTFFRLFFFLFYELSFIFNLVLFIVGILSVFIGCLGAMYQNKIISFLVYSSINNVGFIFISLSLANFDDLRIGFFYLVAYILNLLIIFIILNSVCFNTGRSLMFLSDLLVLMRCYPTLAWCFIISLLSLIGLPPLSGFFSKFFILYSLCYYEYFISYFFLIFMSCISAFYYLRIIKIMAIDKALYLNNSVFLVTKKFNIWGLVVCIFLILFIYFFLPWIYYLISSLILSLMHPYIALFY